MKRVMGMCLSAVLVLGIAAGCSGTGKKDSDPALKELGKDESATVKVMYYDERSFYSDFGNLFLSKHPNIDLQVLNMNGIFKPNEDYNKLLETFIEEQQPDILVLQDMQYEKYANDGKLYGLDDVIKQDKFDTNGISPGLLELLKAKGGGKLYGLTPRFNSQALFYNKDLFDKYGVSYPKDQMSWEETLALAKRFPVDGDADKRVYGLFQQAFNGSPFRLGTSIGSTKGLSYVDPDNAKVTIQTDAWKAAFQTALDALKSGAVYQPKQQQGMTPGMTYQDYLKQNLFIAGRAAMVIDYSYLLDNLNQAKDVLKDSAPLNWEVVTVPVDPAKPDTAPGVSASQIFAVNAKSPNVRAAWEFIKYICSDEYAKIISRAPVSGGLLSRTSYNKDKNGHNLEAFYKLKPGANSSYQGFDKLPQSFFGSFSALADKELGDALNDKKSLDEALQTIQTQGQEQLAKAKEDADKSKAAEKK